MNLRRYLNVIMALVSASIIFTSCGGDGADEPPTPAQTLTLRGVSVTDGASVSAASTTEIILSYNNLVSVANPALITLNGQQAAATAKGMDVSVAVTLKSFTEYTLSIGEGAVTLAGDPKVKSAAKTVTFNTNTGLDVSKVHRSPVNPNITAEARDLYSRLLSVYGQKMLTGAMGAVGWGTEYTDMIAAETGKYPAVVGFDYLHLAASPANWIDYGDITPVKRVAEKGCIVEIQWHWNVPVSEGSNTLASHSDNNRFNPANVMVDGTWENRVALADIEKLAGYMTLLQEARIPVLWRPFHEAAGDYTWGPWFWWGTKGTETTKQLYRWLYDKLTNQYGLNNLIWVWTMQTGSEGRPAPLDVIRAAYPGDDVVDIVGPDIYPDRPLTNQSPQFELVCRAVDGHKMVALTECGNLVSPSAAKEADALWLYFMQWYDLSDGRYGHTNYGGAQWQTVAADPLCVSAADF